MEWATLWSWLLLYARALLGQRVATTAKLKGPSSLNQTRAAKGLGDYQSLALGLVEQQRCDNHAKGDIFPVRAKVPVRT